MLLSMTGYGQAQGQSDACVCRVEAKSVNNRFLKVNCRLPESHAVLEPVVEKLARGLVRRGTLSLNVRMDSIGPAQKCRVHRLVLESYLQQLSGLTEDTAALVGSILQLPGVVEESASDIDPQADWPLMADVITRALENCETMRREEGASMRDEFARVGQVVSGILDQIDALRANSVLRYRDRLLERIGGLLESRGVSISPGDLVREVSILTERSDISEEMVRLRGHLARFGELVDGPESDGRKLDFLAQEMFREANTLSAKANDFSVSHLAVDLKSHVEQIRELVQNVE